MLTPVLNRGLASSSLPRSLPAMRSLVAVRPVSLCRATKSFTLNSQCSSNSIHSFSTLHSSQTFSSTASSPLIRLQPSSLSSSPLSKPNSLFTFARSISTTMPTEADQSSSSNGSSTKPTPISTTEAASSSTKSPVLTRSHPFLRKYHNSSQSPASSSPTSNLATGGAASGSAAYSTNAAGGNSNDGPTKPTLQRVHTRSPSVTAASVAEAILNRHLEAVQSGKSADDSIQEEPPCGCGDPSHHHGHHHHAGHHSDEEGYEIAGEAAEEDDVGQDGYLGKARVPAMSAEAKRFSDLLLGQNKAWAAKTELERPGFFAKLEKQQTPQVLWIGCSDSRVPANQIVNLDPGEVFVHRNIANVVTHTDMNLLSVLEYAVDVLKVRHIIVCGHYGCGGVAAALTQKQFGVIDNWLRNIKDLYTVHRKKFDRLPAGGKEQKDLLTELNVIQSALNVSHTSIIQKAWGRGDEVSIHGWCYRLSDGKIRNLGLLIEGQGSVEDVYHITKEDEQ